jgi:hypothetical protein
MSVLSNLGHRVRRGAGCNDVVRTHCLWQCVLTSMVYTVHAFVSIAAVSVRAARVLLQRH